MELPFHTEEFGENFLAVAIKVCMSYDFIIKFNHHRIALNCSITYLLLPSTVTRKLLIIQASYCRITKFRTHITQKLKKPNIHKCGIVPHFCRLGHKLDFSLCFRQE